MYQHREGLARLITRPNEESRTTGQKLFDARTASAKGLRDYLLQLSIDAPEGGSRLSFGSVEMTFGDLWTPTILPAANVQGGIGDAEYNSARTSGTPIFYDTSPGDGKNVTYKRNADGSPLPPNHLRAWFGPSTFEADFSVEVWLADKGQQALMGLLLEDSFNPTPDWLNGGFRLELPFYANTQADYHLVSSSIGADGRSATQNKYVLRYAFRVTLEIRVPSIRPRLVPVVSVSTNGETEKVPL